MNGKIQVLDVSIDNYRAKEAMKIVMGYMKTEPINIVEMVTLNTLTQLLKTEEQKHYISQLDLTFSGNKSLLEAAGVADSAYLKEVENMLFVKMMMRFFHKNHSRVFLMAETQESLNELQMFLEKNFSGMQIVETATIEEHGKSDDMIINRVNGAEAECIISVIPSPLQEQFIIRNRSLLNARVWFGLGVELREKEKRRFGKRWLKTFLGNQILKREIEKERKKVERCEQCIV